MTYQKFIGKFFYHAKKYRDYYHPCVENIDTGKGIELEKKFKTRKDAVDHAVRNFKEIKKSYF